MSKYQQKTNSEINPSKLTASHLTPEVCSADHPSDNGWLGVKQRRNVPLKGKQGLSGRVVTAVEKAQTSVGFWQCVVSRRQRGRERKKKKVVSVHMAKKELQHKPEMTVCGWAACRGGSTSLWGLALAKASWIKGKVLQESGGRSVWQQLLPIVYGNELRAGKKLNLQGSGRLIFVYVQIWFLNRSDLCFFQTILLISQWLRARSRWDSLAEVKTIAFVLKRKLLFFLSRKQISEKYGDFSFPSEKHNFFK